MPYYGDMDNESSLASDLCRETIDSWKAMSTGGKVLLLAGLLGFMALSRAGSPGVSHTLFALLRIAALTAMILGLIDNARVMDEFYRRVHLLACAGALVISSLSLYALAEFGINPGIRTVSLISFAWLAGFIASFAYLRRA